ncbi:MAG: ABC transporter substrate-binding protein [Candidatus Krumholzibacteriota bacterium]|nr:ABC transporter substrate-binding protein [Candidatus Krumholzibacteriota bacterium]
MKRIFLFLLLSILFSISQAAGGPSISDGRMPERIISLSPSTTEILFALGLEDKIIGVTRFCRYPPAAAEITKVGGYLDPNYEIIAVLEPDLVITLPEQESARRYLDQLGISHITVDNKRIKDILSAITAVGKACDAEKEAAVIVLSLQERIEKIRIRAGRLDKPKTLVSIGRDFEEGSLGKVYVAGRDTYFDEIIDIAGGVNACGSELVRYPVLSAEGLLVIDPDVIIELVPDADRKGFSKEKILRPWEELRSVGAVREGRIYLLTENYTQIPGPRFIMLLEDIAEILHPE